MAAKTPSDPLGQFEQLVMVAVLSLGDDAYGRTVHDKVLKLGGRPILLAAVYVTLDRLEDKSYLTSRLSKPTPERGGRAKRIYTITAAGDRALRDSMATSRRLMDVVKGLKAWNA